MSESVVGFVGIGTLLLLFFLRMPIAFAMAFVGLTGISYLNSWDVGFKFLVRDFFDQFSSYPLGTIPMFVLMGYYADAIGTGEGLYKSARAWLGHLPGGLGLATIGGCAAFAAACGSSVATAGMMGKMAYPEMKNSGYSDIINTGTIAAGGALGTLIPPSNILIVYAILSEQPIGKLFIAGVIPGVIMTVLFMLVIFSISLMKPEWVTKTPRANWKERFMSLGGLVEVLILFALVIGGLAVGWFSATQAGSIGAAGVLVVGLAKGKVTLRRLYHGTKEGLCAASMILFIIAGAIIFGHFMALTRVPMVLVNWIEVSGLSPMAAMTILCAIFFISGFFMDSMALVVLLVPIILPVLFSLHYDLVVFGVVLVILTETGVITPPVGVNVYVVKGIAPGVPLESIFKGAFPFVGAMLVDLILVLLLPQIVTFLPNLYK